MFTIKFKLVLGTFLILLLVAFIAAFAVYQQMESAEVAARLEAENLATAIAYSKNDHVLNRDASDLQNYVTGLHLIYRRDITIVDSHKIGLADSDAGDVGNEYRHDRNGEVAQTLRDGQPRYFTEVSALFPSGTREIVVPIRKGQTQTGGAIIGAVIMEYTPVHNELLDIARTKTRTIVTVAAVCAALAALIGLMIANRIAVSLAGLTRAAADFASGKFDAKVEVDSRDELSVLAATFNDMANGLRDFQNKSLSHERELESKIAERTAELSARNREIMLFSKINDFLQASDTEAEAYSVISRTAKQLFPEDSGALFVTGASRDMVESQAEWGPRAPTNVAFSPNDCWALRRGQAHLVLDDTVARCRHVADDGRMYLCLPLVAHGETLGMLHLSDGAPGNGDPGEDRMAEKLRLARGFSENIGLAIANLRLREGMRSLSIRDSLTGLFNRRYLEGALAQELSRAKREARQLALMMLDIDHFKEFNDRYGHDGGDTVLRELGAYLNTQVRGGDVVCRYGGEEFLLLLSPTTMEGARTRAEQLREGLKNLRVRHAHQDLGAITVSLGMAVFPDHASEMRALVKAADMALYQAKQGGRNRVVVFDGEADQSAS